ncbi:MAG: spermidine synthase [Sulfurimonas sp.]|nr:spermidine synthase [Sulfurimonas sp.]
MKEFIYPEMMVHVPVCTSKEAKSILIISDSSKLLETEAARHNESCVKVIGCNLNEINTLDNDSYDIIISEMASDVTFLSQVNRILKDDGQFSTTHNSLDDTEFNKTLMKDLGKYFKIIMPYNLGNHTTALLSSKEYHPTADINLHRADMIDDLSYYNCDVHVASFAMGNHIRKEYLGIIRN